MHRMFCKKRHHRSTHEVVYTAAKDQHNLFRLKVLSIYVLRRVNVKPFSLNSKMVLLYPPSKRKSTQFHRSNIKQKKTHSRGKKTLTQLLVLWLSASIVFVVFITNCLSLLKLFSWLAAG